MILDAAVQCIEESSLTDFKMSSIAKTAGLSMGSVYKHVQSKQDVLVALAARFEEHAIKLISEILDLPYSPQTKLVALQLLSPEVVYLYGFGGQLIYLLNNEDFLAKASEKWLMKFFDGSKKMEDKFESIMNEAADNGDLICTEDNRDELINDILMSQWALNVGFPQVVYHKSSARLVGNESELPFPLPLDHYIIRCTIRYMNSFPWKEPVNMQELEAIDKFLVNRGWK